MKVTSSASRIHRKVASVTKLRNCVIKNHIRTIKLILYDVIKNFKQEEY